MTQMEWKLVPAEPTLEMCAAGDDCQDSDPRADDSPSYYGYKAMLAVAPEPPHLRDELKVAVEAMERKAFEAWISAPPFEQNVRRYSDNPQTAAWPGNYREYNVQLAWCAWEARAGHMAPNAGNEGRNFIGIERDPKYFEIARNRIEGHNA